MSEMSEQQGCAPCGDDYTAALLKKMAARKLRRTLLQEMYEKSERDNSCDDRIKELTKQRDELEVKYKNAKRIIDEVHDAFYGRNMEVTNWHLNGALEPIDSFFDNNDWELNDGGER